MSQGAAMNPPNIDIFAYANYLDSSHTKYITGAMKAEHRLIFLLTVAYRRVQRAIEQETAAHDLTSAQAGVLFFLGRNDGALIGDVSQALDIVPSAMTGLADRMERAGLVKRRRDGEDGRSQRLHLDRGGAGARQARRDADQGDQQPPDGGILGSRDRRRLALADQPARQVSEGQRRLEHDPEKCAAVFRKDHAQIKGPVGTFSSEAGTGSREDNARDTKQATGV